MNEFFAPGYSEFRINEFIEKVLAKKVAKKERFVGWNTLTLHVK